MATRPGGADLARTKSYQYPAEHVGHLGSGHAGVLDKFKQLCQSKGYYVPASPNGDNREPSHDDETLLRYLRARKWVPEDAFKQFAETEDWRKENKLDQLYETIDIEDYEGSRRLYPQWTGRRDKRGIPIYVFEVANLDAKAVAGHESSTKKPVAGTKVPARLMRLFALYENLVYFVFPLCSQIPDRPFPETPVSQSTNIVDISNVGLKQFWNLKRHMEDASQLATAHYPETLASIYVIGAPSFFPTVWGWIKRWFDPITVSKIYILNDRTMKTTFDESIDPANLPKKYGGQLDWSFGDLPNLEPAIRESIKWRSPSKSIPTGPIRWRTVGNEQIAYAVGTENGKPRRQEIMSVTTDPSHRQASLGVAEENLEVYRTTSGVHTHPPSPPAGATEEVEPDTPLSDIESEDLNSAHPTRDAAGDDNQGDSGTPKEATNTPTERRGTTSTRFEQQNHTHGAGQLAKETPNVQNTADGDRLGVMDPKTISQTPKEHPMPIADDADVNRPASYVDTAKNLAGSAYDQAAGVATAAMGALGLGGGRNAATEGDAQGGSTENKGAEHDPRVEAAPQQNVEDFLRSKVSNSAAGKR